MAIVDYAHTPDALTAVISSLRPETSGRVIVVVGCGGERDATKRSTMGEVAASAADVVVVTDDNPRSEDPAAIRRAVLSGTTVVPLGQRATVMEVPGRAQAIARAVSEAAPGDIVVVAGKGHETGQEIDGHVYAFDDRAVLVDAVRERMTVRGGVNDSGAAPEDQQRPEEER
jgi:UDP-N-acetylmuramoyl-L-alanyl-D-glutamate--2,6-diaminopimelate ligase